MKTITAAAAILVALAGCTADSKSQREWDALTSTQQARLCTIFNSGMTRELRIALLEAGATQAEAIERIDFLRGEC